MAEPDEAPGLTMPVAWTVLALGVSVFAALVVGFSGYNSESAGVMATSFAALPVGFAVSGAIGAVVAHLAFPRRGAVGRTALPLGCGCGGALGLAATSFLFFGVVFPML